MMSVKDYDPCVDCEWRRKMGKCPMANKHHCPTYGMVNNMQIELNHTDKRVPTEFYIEILRARGWHGELKRSTVVKI